MAVRKPTARGISTRERIIWTTAALFRRKGYLGTGLKQISAESGTPFGSIYHSFPGGKEELAAETIRVAGRSYLYLIDAFFANPPDIEQAATDFFTAAGEVLQQTDYVDACPIATVALEVASSNDALRLVTHEIFEEWIEAGTARFQQLADVDRETARELVIVLIAMLEGAFILSRAARNTEALQAAGRAMAAVVRDRQRRT